MPPALTRPIVTVMAEGIAVTGGMIAQVTAGTKMMPRGGVGQIRTAGSGDSCKRGRLIEKTSLAMLSVKQPPALAGGCLA